MGVPACRYTHGCSVLTLMLAPIPIWVCTHVETRVCGAGKGSPTGMGTAYLRAVGLPVLLPKLHGWCQYSSLCWK